MMRTMTVEENLRFCANSRLPASWSTEKKFECVQRASRRRFAKVMVRDTVSGGG